jgi:hypothetical protein
MESLEYQLGVYAATCAQLLIWAPLLIAAIVLLPETIREQPAHNRRRFSLRRFFLWEVSFRKKRKK